MEAGTTAAPSIKLGQEGEAIVCTWLKNAGFTIVARNYSVRSGEVDVIASQKNLVAFVEVKTRMTEHFGLSELITPSKQRKIIKAAKTYLAQHSLGAVLVRFDVALVTYNGRSYALDYVPNAFQESHETF